MSSKSENAKAIQIAEPRDDHTFVLKIDALETILNAENIRDRHVVVVSVAGAIQQGKSFLLNFYLQYLNDRYKRTDARKFLSENVSKHFSWRGGSGIPNTMGILIWSEIFTYDYDNGEKVAIILMDTQGSYDSQSSVHGYSSVFALSVMLSSVLCYNLMNNLRENDLEYLNLFTEYGKLLLNESPKSKPFQMLLFIVRDWPFAYEYKFGYNGGEEVVNERLGISYKQTENMKKFRNNLKASFERINGFLMPYPGNDVAQNECYDGDINLISNKFKDMLHELVKIFAPENLVVKKINGQKIRAKDWIEYAKTYVNVFNGKNAPEAKCIFDATVNTYNSIACLDAKSYYTRFMTKELREKSSNSSIDGLKKVHEKHLSVSIAQFQSKPKMGGAAIADKYLNKLQDEIEKEFKNQMNLFEEKKHKFIKAQISKLKDEAISSYKSLFEKELSSCTSHLSENTMVKNHNRFKKQVIELFNYKTDKQAVQFLEEVAKQLENELENTYLVFKLKNNEKEMAFLKRQKEKERLEKEQKEKELKATMDALDAARRRSLYAESGYFSSQSSYSCYSPTSEYFDIPISRRSSISSRISDSPLPRARWTPGENCHAQTVFLQTGRNFALAAEIFNNSSACVTPKTPDQMRNKFYSSGMHKRC